MLLFPITNKERTVIFALLKIPVFKAILAPYKLDERYFYIPRDRISPQMTKKLIREGKIFRGSAPAED